MPGNWWPKRLIPNITRKWHCSCQRGSVLVNINCNIKAFASNLAICCFLSILFKKLIASQKQANVSTPEVKVFEIPKAYSILFFFYPLPSHICTLSHDDNREGLELKPTYRSCSSQILALLEQTIRILSLL